MKFHFEKTKPKMLMVRFSEEDHAFIKQVAEQQKIPVSSVVRTLIEAALEEYKTQQLSHDKEE